MHCQEGCLWVLLCEGGTQVSAGTSLHLEIRDAGLDPGAQPIKVVFSPKTSKSFQR